MPWWAFGDQPLGLQTTEKLRGVWPSPLFYMPLHSDAITDFMEDLLLSKIDTFIKKLGVMDSAGFKIVSRKFRRRNFKKFRRRLSFFSWHT